MFKPLSTKCWEQFLTLHGFSCKRTSGSHDQWTKKGYRTIPVWGNEKQIPAFHLKTGCKSIGCTLDELYSWADKNC
jgi:predicted RNA binding protein YcfA (HicA-like mRNA interferase family)